MRFVLGNDITASERPDEVPLLFRRRSLAAIFCFLLAVPCGLAWWASYNQVLQAHKNMANEQHLLIAERVASEVDLVLNNAAEHFLAATKGKAGLDDLSQSARADAFVRNCVFDAANAASCPLLFDQAEAADISIGEDHVLLSPVTIIDGKPALVMEHRSKSTVWRAAYATYEFQAFGDRVSFGENAHVAIFDHTGRVLTLPNQEWVDEARDISGISAVREALAGFEGVTTFYSPVFRSEMIAGVAQVDGSGWGVMVPQPMFELAAVARDTAWKTIFPLSVVLALLLALIFTICISAERRLRALGAALQDLKSGKQDVQLPQHPNPLPFWDAGSLTLPFNNLADAMHTMQGNLEEARRIARREQELRLASEKSAQHTRREGINRMAGTLAHNFNNILNVALGHAEAMQNQPDMSPQAIETAAQDIVIATQKGKALTKQLLTTNGLAALTPREIEPAQFATDFLDTIRSKLRANVALNLTMEKKLPALWLDSEQLELALTHLVLNAHDAIDDAGEITLDISTVQAGNGPRVCFQLSDTGRGMSPEDVSQALEPFYSQKALNGAVGIGLPMVAGFARQSGGTLRISSTPNGGTSVSLTFDAKAQGGGVSEGKNVGPQDAHNCNWRLLLVEDEPTLRRVLAERFRRTGCHVTEADDGEKALAILGKGAVFDAIVTDMVMPGDAQGDAVVRAARAHLGDVPIVLSSAYIPQLPEYEFENDTALSIVQKPAMSTEILAQILRLRSRL